MHFEYRKELHVVRRYSLSTEEDGLLEEFLRIRSRLDTLSLIVIIILGTFVDVCNITKLYPDNGDLSCC